MVSPCASILLLVAFWGIEVCSGADSHPAGPLGRLKKDDKQMVHFLTDMDDTTQGQLKQIQNFQVALDAQLAAYKGKLHLAIQKAQELLTEIRKDFAKEAYLVETSHLDMIRPYILSSKYMVKTREHDNKVHAGKEDPLPEDGFQDEETISWRPEASDRATRYAELDLATAMKAKDPAKAMQAKANAISGREDIKASATRMVEHFTQIDKDRFIKLILDKVQQKREAELQTKIDALVASAKSGSRKVSKADIQAAVEDESVNAKLQESGIDEGQLDSVQNQPDVDMIKRDLGELVLKSAVFNAAKLDNKDEAALQNLPTEDLETAAITRDLVTREEIDSLKTKASLITAEAIKDMILDHLVGPPGEARPKK
mmetsp:Transcript_51849/g.82455  ORF Transcript_51849/g.82455 Transcript_51849/m.82455 type:complete len:371 (+) Transcript_51849:46-1158(+)